MKPNLASCVFVVVIAAGCASAPPNPDATRVMVAPGAAAAPRASGDSAATPPVRYVGYLKPDAAPRSLDLLPPPPAPGSAAAALDEDVSRSSLALQDTPRGALATRDADLTFPNAAASFSCAVGAPITQQDTPHLYVIMQRTLADSFNVIAGAKDHYLRARPYLLNKQPLCAPAGTLGSYPSGHSTTGWAWALVLTQMAPDRTEAILARGRAFGQSRLICNAHWQSDVDEGRFMGAATVARLHADATFRDDLAAATRELAVAREKGLKPTRDCDAETAALALQPASLR